MIEDARGRIVPWRSIAKGRKYPSDRLRRLLFRPYDCWPTFDSEVEYRFVFFRPTDGFGHIKLCGLHDVRPFSWRRVTRSFNRHVDRVGIWAAVKAASRQITSMSHEQSTRIIASFEAHGVSLYVYEYRDGSGPATDGWSYSSRSVFFPYGGEITVLITPSWVHFLLDDVQVDVFPVFSGSGSSLLTMQSGAHAKNGPSSPVASGTFTWCQVRA